ncbi:Glucokinase [Porphyridium purpureum]|uniref:Glucokinase n=1 Tax=Porphyridium purpureum TaxID=35688 RepID=A0A5J4YN03_PORPP|nr:Glucokinase [Porphyridium purpureum]KAA8492881.1 Glucokinase [Porphyridium purpureum]|eukprot:POR3062..scf237_24
MRLVDAFIPTIGRDFLLEPSIPAREVRGRNWRLNTCASARRRHWKPRWNASALQNGSGSALSVEFVVAADVGGTNSRLSLFPRPSLHSPSSLSGGLEPVASVKYKNDDYKSFDEVVDTFLLTCSDSLRVLPSRKSIVMACFAVAGVVRDNSITFTNRADWVVDGYEMRRAFGFPCVLLNDFAANGYAVTSLQKHEYTTLQPGSNADPHGVIAVVGAGTGLGECFVVPFSTSQDAPSPSARRYGVFGSEGGHVDFAPQTDLELKMVQWMQARLRERLEKPEIVNPHVSVERVVSGKGVFNVYRFLRAEFPERVDLECDEKIMQSSDPGAMITRLAPAYGLAVQSLEIVLSAYGSEVGNVALKYVPTGGLFIAGGIAPALLRMLPDQLVNPESRFRVAMVSKGRMRDLVQSLPVHVITADDLGVRGALVYAVQLLFERTDSKMPEKSPR